MCFNGKRMVRLGINKRNIFGANRVKFRRKIACAEFRRIGVSEASSVVYGFFQSGTGWRRMSRHGEGRVRTGHGRLQRGMGQDGEGLDGVERDGTGWDGDEGRDMTERNGT